MTVGKVQFSKPAKEAVHTALFGEKLKCFTVRTISIKPDLVAISCIFVKMKLVMFRTIKEKLRKRKAHANLNTEATSNIPLF